MLVLGRNQDLHVPGLLPLIDRDLDGHEAAEILQQLFGLIVQVTLLLGTQTTMTRRDLDLHPCAPCYDFRPAASGSRGGDYKKVPPIGASGQDDNAKIVPAFLSGEAGPPYPRVPSRYYPQPVPSRIVGTIAVIL